MSFSRTGRSTGLAAVFAIGADGLPAGTTLRFTASSVDPTWSISFNEIEDIFGRSCTGLPASVPGDNLNSVSVQCTTPALVRFERPSVVVTVADPSCSGNGDGVVVVVVGQRPGGPPSDPLQLTLGCPRSTNVDPAIDPASGPAIDE